MEGNVQPRSNAKPPVVEPTKFFVDDEKLMSLVELALDLLPAERDAYLVTACTGNSDLLARARHYVQSEERMGGFMLDPLFELGAPENPFEPDELVDGRFRIRREIARGGMGIVYEAFDERLERRIAIKCAKRGFRKRLSPEVRNASEISHPNVCKIFEMHRAPSREGELDFITMEYLEGETLGERLQRGPIPAEEAELIARQLCSGLAQAHRNQVIHGDLKSNNIILTKTAKGGMRAVITDFGLARQPHSALSTAQTATVGGTPDYMAPELWRGEKASIASDIYALGVLLYELVCGRRPFPSAAQNFTGQAAGETGVIRKAAENAVIGKGSASKENAKPASPHSGRPPSAHPKWDRILVRCLDPDPTRRFQDADEIVLAMMPSHARHWFMAGAAAVLAVLGLVGYERVVPKIFPAESIRLAVLPFASDVANDPSASQLTQGLLVDTADRLSHSTGGRAHFTVIPLADAVRNKVTQPDQAQAVLGATHTLSGSIRHDADGRIAVSATLTDAITHMRLKDWQTDYAPNELGHMPVAMAGMVTSTLHLPPLTISAAATISPAAYPFWAQGVALTSTDPGKVDQAIDLLTRAVDADPGSPVTHASLANAEYIKFRNTADQSWWNKARASLSRAEQLNPDIAAVRFVGGTLNNQAGKYDEAETDLKRATELEPMNGDYWRQLGTIYSHSKPDQAVAAFQKAIDLQPQYFRNFEELGSFYMDRYDFDRAVEQFQKMVQAAPNLAEAHYALSRPYLSMGRFSESENQAFTAVQLRETSNGVQALAASLFFQDRDREAIPYFQRALELGPPPNNKYLLYLNLGSVYRRIGDAVTAARMYGEARRLAYVELERNPKDALVRSRLAYLQAQLGNLQDAKLEIQLAQALLPTDVNIRWMAIQTHEVLGDRAGTLAVLQDSPDWLLHRATLFSDLAGLQKNPRFQELLVSRHLK